MRKLVGAVGIKLTPETRDSSTIIESGKDLGKNSSRQTRLVLEVVVTSAKHITSSAYKKLLTDNIAGLDNNPTKKLTRTWFLAHPMSSSCLPHRSLDLDTTCCRAALLKTVPSVCRPTNLTRPGDSSLIGSLNAPPKCS